MVAAGCTLAVQITGLQIDGHADYYLPSQAEAHLMAANLNGDMPEAWYWTSTQCSTHGAWGQYFRYGSQAPLTKRYEGRARAVRKGNFKESK